MTTIRRRGRGRKAETRERERTSGGRRHLLSMTCVMADKTVNGNDVIHSVLCTTADVSPARVPLTTDAGGGDSNRRAPFFFVCAPLTGTFQSSWSPLHCHDRDFR